MKINIAIDGPSAAGKSTIAKELCKRLGYRHIDTGAMYRCVAYKALKNNISLDDEMRIVAMMDETQIRINKNGEILLDGVFVEQYIRSNEVSMAASAVSKLEQVRERLVAQQQAMAKDYGYVMDGRDIGTVVLKDLAEVKIFLTASAQARGERRHLQNLQLGIESDLQSIIEDIKQRDLQDSNRKYSPLRKAEDAIEIDSSHLSIEEVVDAIIEIVNKYIK